MHRRQILYLTALTALSVLGLAVAWEFWLEPIVVPVLYGEIREEDVVERLEFIAASMIFVLLSLIMPTVISLRNAGERNRAEAALRRISSAVEHSHHAVILTDARGVIEYVNPAFTRITGYGPDEAVGRTPAFLASGETPPETFDEMWATIAAGKPWLGELRNRRKNGELYWDFVSISAVRGADGAIVSYVGVQQDVTERKRLEREVARGQRMEAVGQLTGGVAHDFNNLLTVVLGNLGFLADELGDDERRQELVRRARAAALRGADLTQRLLAFARRLPLRTTTIELRELVAETVALLRRTLGDNIEIGMVEPDRASPVRADPAQLQNALVNLGLNARDAMPDGGRLSFEIADARLGPDDLAGEPDSAPGDYVMVAVRDTGHGMDPAIRDSVFEPFFTTKGRSGHSGLGLSMVYGFVRQSRGHIAIDTAPGAGTTVRLYLPRSDAAPVDQADAAGRDLPAGRETVLVVEDDAAVRHVAGRLLRELGYRVLEAADGPAAMALVDGVGAIDALFTDIVLPGGMSGPDLARALEQGRPGLAVVLASGHAEPDEDGRFIHFVAKPYTKRDLAVTLRRALDAAREEKRSKRGRIPAET